MEPLSINKYALTVAEAASVLGISSCKVYLLIKEGKLAAQKSVAPGESQLMQ